MKIIYSRYRSLLVDEHIKYRLRLCPGNYERCISYRKICSVMHQLRSRKVNEKHVLITYGKLFYFEKVSFY
jgi:hypothetical protein